jgi:hypothetical protein
MGHVVREHCVHKENALRLDELLVSVSDLYIQSSIDFIDVLYTRCITKRDYDISSEGEG